VARLLAGFAGFGLALLLMLVWFQPALPAMAQETTIRPVTYPDRLSVFRVNADVVAPRDGAVEVRFDVTLDYQLLSADDGFLLVFIFEDNTQTSTMNSDQGYRVKLGPGRARMQESYAPHPGAQNVAIFAGLFSADETLLAWSSTDPDKPISLESVPGRAAFARAMDARNASDFAGAVRYLTTAVEASPDNGFFYYWRADTFMRLNNYDAAIADFGWALDRMPDDRASLLGRGVAWLWKDSWQQAISDATTVIDAPVRSDQLTAWAFRARGVARANLGQTGPATSDYQSYLSLWPQAPDRGTVERWIADLGTVR